MYIRLTSLFVDDQEKALEFYTQKLGFVKRKDIPVGEDRYITLGSPDEENPTELMLEPNSHPACKPYQQALYKDNIPMNAFEVDNLLETYNNLKNKNVVFKLGPTDLDDIHIAILDDTCGNLIQIFQTIKK